MDWFFLETRNNDKVVIGLNLPEGEKEIIVSSIFDNGEKINDFYSNQTLLVKDGKVRFSSKDTVVLLENK